MPLAEEEEGPPGLQSGGQQGEESGEDAEPAGGLRSPLLHSEVFPSLQGDVPAQPHSLGEEKTFPVEVGAVLGERDDGDEAEEEGQEIENTLSEEEIVHRHGVLDEECCPILA